MTNLPPRLDGQFCRQRQTRLLGVMRQLKLDRVVLTAPEHVYYLTGFLPHRLLQAAVVLDADDACTLCAPNSEPEDVAADRIVTFAAQWLATLRQDQAAAAAEALRDALAVRSRDRVGFEFSRCGPPLLNAICPGGTTQAVDVEPSLWQLRRRKDPDELAMIRHAIGCTDAMYRTAREIIEPGVSELEVFNQLQTAAVTAAGEPLTATGNDYQSNSPGGPPRHRPAQTGELFILDLGPAYRGYYADNCRTFAVNRQPNDAQQQAWRAIVGVLHMVEETVRPGVSCRDLYERAKTMLDAERPGAFFHHLGHGIGLSPHETPHLNPHWDDRFEEGDVFTAEPGLYAEDLRAGIRLEQDYLVTADGVQRLTSFPLEL